MAEKMCHGCPFAMAGPHPAPGETAFTAWDVQAWTDPFCRWTCHADDHNSMMCRGAELFHDGKLPVTREQMEGFWVREPQEVPHAS